MREHAGGWERGRSPYLIESQIEDYGRFAQGVKSAKGWRRWAGYALVLIFLSPFAFMAGAYLVNLFQ